MTGYKSKKAAAQEPIGEVVVESMGVRGSDAMQVRLHFYKKFPPIGSKIYTTPPQRIWVGLTDEDKQELDEKYGDDYLAHLDAVEAKLKEKNNG